MATPISKPGRTLAVFLAVIAVMYGAAAAVGRHVGTEVLGHEDVAVGAHLKLQTGGHAVARVALGIDVGEVLELIANGLSNREIADKLFICRETVRWHIRSLYSKIGAKDRASAVRYGKEYLLVETGSLNRVAARVTPPDLKIADEKMAAD